MPQTRMTGPAGSVPPGNSSRNGRFTAGGRACDVSQEGAVLDDPRGAQRTALGTGGSAKRIHGAAVPHDEGEPARRHLAAERSRRRCLRADGMHERCDENDSDPDPNVDPPCCGQCGPRGCGDIEPFEEDPC